MGWTDFCQECLKESWSWIWAGELFRFLPDVPSMPIRLCGFRGGVKRLVPGSWQHSCFISLAPRCMLSAVTAEHCFLSKRTPFTQLICAPASWAILYPAEIVKESNCDSMAETAKRHHGDPCISRTLSLTSEHRPSWQPLPTEQSESYLCSSREARAALVQHTWEECFLLLLLRQQRRDLHPLVGHSGSSKSLRLHGFKRQLEKSMEEIPTKAIKHRILLLVEESSASLSAGCGNWKRLLWFSTFLLAADRKVSWTNLCPGPAGPLLCSWAAFPACLSGTATELGFINEAGNVTGILCLRVQPCPRLSAFWMQLRKSQEPWPALTPS